MSDDEYDDELPPIIVNSSAAKENQYVMPSADVIASQRAYEEVCEEELRQLRSQYEREEVVTLCHDSSGSEGEATLAAAIESMKVQASQSSSQLDAALLLQKLIAHITDWDLTFLQDYLDAIQNEDAPTVRHVTDNLMYTIEDVVKQNVRGGNMLNEQELMVVALWLCAASIWSSPRVPSARRSLQVLLCYFTEDQLKTWCCAVGRVLDSAALVRTSDVISAPSPATRATSALLLRAALHNLAPQYNLDRIHSKLSVEEVCEVLGGMWRTLSPAQQYTAAQVVGRTLVETIDGSVSPQKNESAMDTSDISDAPTSLPGKSDVPIDAPTKDSTDRGAITRLLTLMATQLPQHRYRPDYLRVLMAVSKLQNLFKN